MCTSMPIPTTLSPRSSFIDNAAVVVDGPYPLEVSYVRLAVGGRTSGVLPLAVLMTGSSTTAREFAAVVVVSALMYRLVLRLRKIERGGGEVLKENEEALL
jgi:hypothetical protein